MNSKDRLSELLKKWEPRSPHSTAKFVNDTLRAIRMRETRPAWKLAWDSWFGVLDGWIVEWLPAPRTLVPVAAALLMTLTAWQWMHMERQADQLAALKWRQQMAQPMSQRSLSGVYASLVKE